MKAQQLFTILLLSCATCAVVAADPQKELPATGMYLAKQGGASACFALTSDPTSRLVTISGLGSYVCRPSVRGSGGNAVETGRLRCIDQGQPEDSSDTGGMGLAGKFTGTSITIDRVVQYTYAAGVTTRAQDARLARKITFRLDKTGACSP